MREEINDKDLEVVAGGAVLLSEKRNRINFSTLGEGYTLKIPYSQANDEVVKLYVQSSGMNENEFDLYVKKFFQNKGWI